MIRHNNYSKLGLIIMMVAITLCGCGSKEAKIEDYNTIKIAEVYDSTYGTSELYKDTESDNIYEVQDSKIVNTIANSTHYSTDEIMEISEDTEAYNILNNDQYATDTWEATLDESSAFVNYLESKGYTITRQVNTQEFIDINMKNSMETKRILIYSDKIIVSTIEPKELNIENYIK